MLLHLQRLDDPSVAVDVVKAGVVRGGRFDLECALALLPMLDGLLASTYDEHALAALAAVSQIVVTFGALIRDSRVARDTLGVDLSAEARQQRCQACHELLRAMLPRLRQMKGREGVGSAPAELCERLRAEVGVCE
jgi:hypothetical protein